MTMSTDQAQIAANREFWARKAAQARAAGGSTEIDFAEIPVVDGCGLTVYGSDELLDLQGIEAGPDGSTSRYRLTVRDLP